MASISCENTIRRMSLGLITYSDEPTLVQVMAWCRQATSRYPSQCWPRFMSPWNVARPNWFDFPICVMSQFADHHTDTDTDTDSSYLQEHNCRKHRYCSDVITRSMASRITGVFIACSTVCSGTEQRKHQSSASRAFVWGLQRWPVVPITKGQ